MKLIIKNMVGNSCKMVVREELKKLGLHPLFIDLGEVEIMENLSTEQFNRLKMNLYVFELELMDDQRTILIEKIINVIKEMVRRLDGPGNKNYPDFLAERLQYNYTYLSNLFSKTQGISIKQFFILRKIERIKELIIVDKLSISEIAWKMDYSSVAHLSNQFKKVTGLSPSQFKQLKLKKQIRIEEISSSYDINIKEPTRMRSKSKTKIKPNFEFIGYAFEKKFSSN